MTVETGDYIDNLDPNAPDDTQPAGEANEHLQLIKRVLDRTFVGKTGDRYDDVSGPILIGPVEINGLPGRIDAVNAELGLPGSSRLDALEATSIPNDAPQTITEDWTFTGSVDMNNGAQVGGVDIATVDDILTDRERGQIPVATVSANYTVQTSDFSRGKIVYVGAGGHTITVPTAAGPQVGDILLIANASSNPTGVLTIAVSAGVAIVDRFNRSRLSATITGRYKNVGLHYTAANVWQLTGDYD